MLGIEPVIELHVEKRVVEDRVTSAADKIGVLPRAVRLRDDGRYLLCHTAHARPRNDVAGKRLSRGNAVGADYGRGRIIDGANPSGGGSQSREISVQEVDGGGRVKPNLGRAAKLRIVRRNHEKGMVPSVVQLGDPYWPEERKPIIVVLEWQTVSFEKRPGIQDIVAEILKKAAVQLIRTGLQAETDDGRLYITVLG